MRTTKIIILAAMLVMAFSMTSCRRNTNAVWEDTKTAGRHVNRGVRSLGGKNSDSRQVRSRGDFMGPDGEMYYADAPNSSGNDFVPLSDDPNCDELAMADMVNRPAREMPGEPGSSIPGIEAFQDPTTNPRLAAVFRNITFAYNSPLVKGQDNLETIRNVANYMKSHPNTYIFVEGHCDERGPEAYNLSLGSYRSNGVRNLLINDGVSPDNIFTISYGRERPLVAGHDEDTWNQNRRAEFKVYER